MDPFSLTVGTVGLIGALKTCLVLAGKFVGPSKLGKAELAAIRSTLYEALVILKSFKAFLKDHRNYDDQLQTLTHLAPVMEDCQKALQSIEAFMQSTSTIEKLWKGTRFDKSFKSSIAAIDESTKVFKLAVVADQQALTLGIDNYLHVVGKDVKQIKIGQEEMQSESSYATVKAWLGAQADNDMNSQRHQNHGHLRYPGSCEWLESHVDFVNWVENPPISGAMTSIWLKGSPGAGKSYVCSKAIDSVAKTKSLYLYYFCRFDYQLSESGSATTTADEYKLRMSALLVDQLLRQLWRNEPSVANHICKFIQTEEKNTTALAKVVQILLKNQAVPGGTQSNGLPSPRRNVYLLLDGLDETRGHFTGHDLLHVARELFRGLEDEVCLRLWVSSQDNLNLTRSLPECAVINLDDQAESDVRDHLAREVPRTLEQNFGDIDHEVHGEPFGPWVLKTLQTRAKGNFLYAKLAIHQMSGAISPHDLISFIASEIPEDFTEMYRRIFFGYKKPQLKYVSLLFSLVAFARRPLRLWELQDLITLALSDPNKGPDPIRRPRGLQTLFPPLIEKQHDPQQPENPFCRLRHSTVHRFLTRNPHILCSQGSTCDGVKNCEHLISATTFGKLGLRYLSQPKFSNLMPVEEGQLCNEDPLMLYFAKFSTKHLDDMEPTSAHRKAVATFVSSSHFQTLLQIQSLSVADQFEQIPYVAAQTAEQIQIMQSTGYHHLQRQCFPKWFSKDASYKVIEEYTPYHGQYRHFVNEWGYLLSRAASSSDPDYFPGEVERCLSGMMGQSSFLAQMKEKYPSFILSQEDYDCLNSDSRVLVERLSPTGDRFTVVSTITSRDSVPIPAEPGSTPLFIRIETWNLRGSTMPSLRYTNDASVADLLNTLGLELKAPVGTTEDLKEGYMWLEDPPVTDHEPSFTLIDDKQARRGWETISYDFRTRDNIVVSATRSKYKSRRACQKSCQKHPDQPAASTESQPDWDSSDCDSLSSEGEDDSAAYETCSEGSTEFDSDGESSDAEIDESEGSYSGDNFGSSDTADEDSSDDSYDSCSSYDEDGYPVPSRRRKIQGKEPMMSGIIQTNLIFDEGEGQTTRTRGKPMSRYSKRKNRINASLSVYDIASGSPVRLLHFQQDLSVMLYSSPPALHPSKSLVAWPLGGGDILFADYLANTFFTRGAVPNTRDSRHITMQSHFSACGRYLHIASIEARIVEKHKHKSDRYGQEPGSNSVLASKSAQSATVWATDPELRSQELVLSAFITTHRLSVSKTTRSPPRLIHRAIVGLGRYAALSLDNLPITFNWAPSYVYLNLSGHRLNLIRIALFRPGPSSQGLAQPIACAPQLPVMLPLSATGRQVHYLPPPSTADDSTDSPQSDRRGIVLMGGYGGYGNKVQLRPSVEVPHRDHHGVDAGHTMPYPCPAVGFYVDEDRDFGRWLPYEAEGTGSPARGEKFRDGRLVRRKMEGFNAQDDIDLEGICYICKGPVYFSATPLS